MSDLLSLSLSISSLLGACLSARIELRKLRAAGVDDHSTITASMADVKSLRSISEKMEDVFEELEVSRPRTGQMGTYWRNFVKSLKLTTQSMEMMSSLLVDANEVMKSLQEEEKQKRLRETLEQLVLFRQRIQVYTDILRLSMQTIKL